MQSPDLRLPESKLIYDPNVDPNLIENILFVHSSVSQLQQASNAQTFVVVYDYSSSSDEAMELLKSKFLSHSLDRIGFAFHYTGSSSHFMNNEMLFNDSDLQNGVYSKNTQFILDLIRNFHIPHVPHIDFLACNTLQDDSWKQYYQMLQTKTGVIVGASDDNTGNLKYGGDWIMESTQEDISQIYFSSTIINFASLLATYTDVFNTRVSYSYTVGDNTATLLQVTDLTISGTYTILSSFDISGTTYYVKRIIQDAFLNCTSITNIIIPVGITSIGNNAFRGCNKINTNIVIPQGVIETGTYLFYGCSLMPSVTIPETLTVMNQYLFSNALSLTAVNYVPQSGIRRIEEGAFQSCSSLKNVQIPSAVIYLGGSVFSGCGVTAVNIPGGIVGLNGYTFNNCTSLTSVTIQSGLTSIAQYTFNNCTALTRIIMPASVIWMDLIYPAFAGTKFNNIIMYVGNSYYRYIGTIPASTTGKPSLINDIFLKFSNNANNVRTNTALWTPIIFSSVTPSVTSINVGGSFSVTFYSLQSETTYSISGVTSADLSGALFGTLPGGTSIQTFNVLSGELKTIVITLYDGASDASNTVSIRAATIITSRPTNASLVYPNTLSAAVIVGGVATTTSGSAVAGQFQIDPSLLTTVYNVGTYTDVSAVFYPNLTINYKNLSTLNYNTCATTIQSLTVTRATAAQLQTISIPVAALKNAGYTAAELKTANFTTAQLKNASFSPTELKSAGVTNAELYSVFTTPVEQKSVTKMVVTELLASTSKAIIAQPSQLVGYTLPTIIESVVAVKVTDVSNPVTINRTELNNGTAAVYAVLDVSGTYLIIPTHSSQIRVMNIGNEKYRILSKEGNVLQNDLLAGATYTYDGTTVTIGSVVASMTPPPGIDIVFTDFLDLSFGLTSRGLLPELSTSVPIGPYTLERDISLSTIKSVFYFQTDNNITYDSSYTKYFVDISGWSNTTIKQDLNPMNYLVLNRDNGAFGTNWSDNLGKHFLRYIVEQLFGTYLGVDLFNNEDAVYQDISLNAYNYVYTAVLNKLKRVDKTFGATSDLSDIFHESNGWHMRDSEGTYNICRNLIKQMAASSVAKSRFDELELRVGEGAGAGIYNVPFRSGDSIYYSVVVTPAPNQNSITGLSVALEPKKYILKLNIV